MFIVLFALKYLHFLAIYHSPTFRIRWFLSLHIHVAKVQVQSFSNISQFKRTIIFNQVLCK